MSIHFQIRKAVLADAPAIAANNAAMAAETENRVLDPRIALAGAKALIKDPHKGFYLLAERPAPDPRPLGQLMITFEWSDWRDGCFWWIQSVYVEPDCRQAGVFSALFRRAGELARARKDTCGLRLYVDCDNERAKMVYEGLGMAQTAYRLYELEF
jgi:GNAT superfamily N-acetyltransferase